MFHQISGHHGLAISHLRETEAQGIWLMDGGATFPATSRPVHALKSTFCPFLQPKEPGRGAQRRPQFATGPSQCPSSPSQHTCTDPSGNVGPGGCTFTHDPRILRPVKVNYPDLTWSPGAMQRGGGRRGPGLGLLAGSTGRREGKDVLAAVGVATRERRRFRSPALRETHLHGCEGLNNRRGVLSDLSTLPSEKSQAFLGEQVDVR